MNKALVWLLAPLLAACWNVHATDQIMLTADVIKAIDGKKPWGIFDLTIYMMIQQRKYLKDLRTTECYSFEGKTCTLQDMITVEQDILTKERSSQRHNSLKSNLHEVLDSFMVHMQPHLKDARGTKEQMLVLIKEWAGKAGRANTHLLEWSSSKDGQEAVTFKQYITSFDDFDHFCADLTGFLEALIRSCPKARAQFKELMSSQGRTTEA